MTDHAVTLTDKLKFDQIKTSLVANGIILQKHLDAFENKKSNDDKIMETIDTLIRSDLRMTFVPFLEKVLPRAGLSGIQCRKMLWETYNQKCK